MLKPQDVLVLLKAAVNPDRALGYGVLAAELHMSASEAHASVRRAKISGLAQALGDRWTPVRSALVEFCVHGVRYAFPAELGAPARGIPTSFGAPPLSEFITSTPGDAPVWKHPQGEARGPALSPLYSSAPAAALGDPKLYQALSLLDAIRAGRARERELGAELLTKLLYP